MGAWDPVAHAFYGLLPQITDTIGPPLVLHGKYLTEVAGKHYLWERP